MYALAMRRLAIVICLIAMPMTAQTISDRIDHELPWLLKTYQTLHTAPELSMREEKTSSLVAARLREIGYDVTDHVGKYEEGDATCYGVVAVMKNGKGPVVLLRTDMDALPIGEQTGLPYASTVPNVMHACGHDLHMTSLLGTAKLLADMKSQWHGTLVLIGQPAEEVVKGAGAMLGDGLYTRFPKPDYALAVHDHAQLEAGKVGIRSGYALAAGDSVDSATRRLTRIAVDGNPPVQVDFALNGGDLPGSTATAARVVNAIPKVCEAQPGILGALDVVVGGRAASGT